MDRLMDFLLLEDLAGTLVELDLPDFWITLFAMMGIAYYIAWLVLALILPFVLIRILLNFNDWLKRGNRS